MLLIKRREFKDVAHRQKLWGLIGLVNLTKWIILGTVLQKRFTIESRLSWLGFPGLIKMLAMLQGVFFVVLVLNPAATEIIKPNITLVMKGEVWRLVSWVLMPPYPPPIEGSLVFPALFTLIVLRICFLFDETLERAWGVTRTSIYVYATIICQGIALNILSSFFSGHVYYLAIFFAFATILPNYTFLLGFFLPVKVWIFAVLAGVGILITCLQAPLLLPFYLVAYLPYIIYALPVALKWRKTRSQITKRRNKFQSAQQTSDGSLHHCHNCGRTENSDPDLQFRVAADDEEYCLDHLP